MVGISSSECFCDDDFAEIDIPRNGRRPVYCRGVCRFSPHGIGVNMINIWYMAENNSKLGYTLGMWYSCWLIGLVTKKGNENSRGIEAYIVSYYDGYLGMYQPIMQMVFHPENKGPLVSGATCTANVDISTSTWFCSLAMLPWKRGECLGDMKKYW